MNASVKIQAGVCGFQTSARVLTEDSQNVTFEIESDCGKIRALGGVLKKRGAIDAFQEIHPEGESVLLSCARETLTGCCAGCAVPVGLFKGMQIAAGLALPQDIAIALARD